MTSETVGMLKTLWVRLVRDILGSVEVGTKDFGSETLDALDVGWLCKSLITIESQIANIFRRRNRRRREGRDGDGV